MAPWHGRLARERPGGMKVPQILREAGAGSEFRLPAALAPGRLKPELQTELGGSHLGMKAQEIKQ